MPIFLIYYLFLAIGFCIATIIRQGLHPENDGVLISKNEEVDAIYMFVAFLDTFANYGQGILIFAFFGLESKFVFKPLQKWFNTVWSLYQNPPSINSDAPRLYHWTLHLINKIFQAFPKAERTSAQPTYEHQTSYISGNFRPHRISVIM